MVANLSLELSDLLLRIRQSLNRYGGIGLGCSLFSILLFVPSMVIGAPVGKLKEATHGNLGDVHIVQHESMHSLVDRGRYMIQVGGCNDCHTPGYNESGGQMPEQEWLTGAALGFAGPWGTTYPANLRLYFDSLNESEWRIRAHTPMRPPMPSPSLMAMTDDDLDAIYTYVRHLGPAGVPAPAYVPPGESISTPYLDFVPHAN